MENKKIVLRGFTLSQFFVLVWWAFFNRNKLLDFTKKINDGYNPIIAYKEVKKFKAKI